MNDYKKDALQNSVLYYDVRPSAVYRWQEQQLRDTVKLIVLHFRDGYKKLLYSRVPVIPFHQRSVV